jgi:hypothetical protein
VIKGNPGGALFVGCSWLQEVSVAVCHAIVCAGRLLLLVGSVAVCGPAAVSLGWS